MIPTVSPSITCPFLPPRHLSVSHVTVKQFCREERWFQYRYDRLFLWSEKAGLCLHRFLAYVSSFFFLSFCWENIGDKNRKIILKSAKRWSNDPQFEGKGLATLVSFSYEAVSSSLSVKSKQIWLGIKQHSLSQTFSLVFASTREFFYFQQIVKARPPPLEAILVIFGSRALIFFCLKALGKNGKWHHFCAHAQWWSPWRRKNVKKGAPRSVEFNFFINCNRHKRFFTAWKKKGRSTKRYLRFFNFRLGT